MVPVRARSMSLLPSEELDRGGRDDDGPHGHDDERMCRREAALQRAEQGLNGCAERREVSNVAQRCRHVLLRDPKTCEVERGVEQQSAEHSGDRRTRRHGGNEDSEGEEGRDCESRGEHESPNVLGRLHLKEQHSAADDKAHRYDCEHEVDGDLRSQQPHRCHRRGRQPPQVLRSRFITSGMGKLTSPISATVRVISTGT